MSLIQKVWLAALLFAVLIGPSASAAAFSPDDLDLLRTKIWKMIERSREPDCEDCGTPLLAQLVRLSFHDCVGGCDGVVDVDLPANAGLKVPIDAVQPLYLEYQNKTNGELSRADFWALIGTLALYRGAANQPCLPSGRLPAYPSVPFLLGRKDRSSTKHESTDFPDPLQGITPTLAWGDRVFGFDTRDTVAVLGAHTLGRARRYNSGFENSWTATPDVLDNQYYNDMTDGHGKFGGWKQVAVEEELALVKRQRQARLNHHHKGHHHHHHHDDDKGQLYQWVHVTDSEGLMFNSDICLYKDIDPAAKGADKGQVSCTYTAGDQQCPDQSEQVGPVEPMEEFSVSELVDLYARDNYKWMQDFSKAFTIMIQAGSAAEALKEIPYLPPLSCRLPGEKLQAGQLPKAIATEVPVVA